VSLDPCTCAGSGCIVRSLSLVLGVYLVAMLWLLIPIPALLGAVTLVILLCYCRIDERRIVWFTGLATLIAVLVVGVLAYLGQDIPIPSLEPSCGSCRQGLPPDLEPSRPDVSPWYRVFLALNLLLPGIVPLYGAARAWLRHRRITSLVLAGVALPLLIGSMIVVSDGLSRR